MSNPANVRKMISTKGARHAHKVILAQGRKLCEEANVARRANAARRREEKAALKAQELAMPGWRYGGADMGGV
jgi:hypothetical protein